MVENKPENKPGTGTTGIVDTIKEAWARWGWVEKAVVIVVFLLIMSGVDNVVGRWERQKISAGIDMGVIKKYNATAVASRVAGRVTEIQE